jgi:hypothetical protein
MAVRGVFCNDDRFGCDHETFTKRLERWREVAVTIFKTTVLVAAVALNSGFVC